jgi:type IV secretion system protein TrbL
MQSMGSHLAKGALDTFQDKMDSMKESVASRVAQTTGGQIAEAIQQRTEDSAGVNADSQSNLDSSSLSLLKGSLAKGETQRTHEEVSQFVNKAAGMRS